MKNALTRASIRSVGIATPEHSPIRHSVGSYGKKSMLIVLTTTNPTLLLNANPKRRRLNIQMQATDVDTNNTGRIHLGFGFQPTAAVNHQSQGDVLIQSAAIEEPTGNLPIANRYKGAIWATSSQANQSLVVEEEVEETTSE